MLSLLWQLSVPMIEDLQVNGLTVSRVEGYGAQRGSDNWTKGMKLEERMKQKVKIEVVVSSEDWADLTEKAIRKAAVEQQLITYSPILFPFIKYSPKIFLIISLY